MPNPYAMPMLPQSYAPNAMQRQRPGMPAQQPMQQPMQPPTPSLAPGAGTTDPAMAEYYQQLLGVYGDQMEMGDLDEQLLRAQALRDTAMPEGRNSGRVYTAANPLEFVGAGIKQYRGAKKEQGVNAEREAVRKRIGEAVKQYGAGIPGA